MAKNALDSSLDELERVTGLWREAQHALEREEKCHLETIDARDQAEECVSQMYYLVTGNSPQWSNVFGYEQALEDVSDALALLKKSIPRPRKA